MTPVPIAFAPHDHTACSSGVLDRAVEMCRSEGLRLTPVRRRVLEILLEQHRAMGAYEVLERLVSDGYGRQPPVVYRALDFLVENGLAHRIRRLNAFAACLHPGEEHSPVFIICRDCRIMAEVPASDARAAIDSVATGMGFEVERVSLEAVGLCPSCMSGPGASR